MEGLRHAGKATDKPRQGRCLARAGRSRHRSRRAGCRLQGVAGSVCPTAADWRREQAHGLQAAGHSGQRLPECGRQAAAFCGSGSTAHLHHTQQEAVGQAQGGARLHGRQDARVQLGLRAGGGGGARLREQQAESRGTQAGM